MKERNALGLVVAAWLVGMVFLWNVVVGFIYILLTVGILTHKPIRQAENVVVNAPALPTVLLADVPPIDHTQPVGDIAYNLEDLPIELKG